MDYQEEGTRTEMVRRRQQSLNLTFNPMASPQEKTVSAKLCGVWEQHRVRAWHARIKAALEGLVLEQLAECLPSCRTSTGLLSLVSDAKLVSSRTSQQRARPLNGCLALNHSTPTCRLVR